MRRPILLLAALAALVPSASCTRPAARAGAPDTAAAVDRTLAAGTGTADLTFRFDPPGDGAPVVAHGHGGFDLAAGRRWLVIDLGPLVAAAGGPGAELARAGTVVDGDDVYVRRADGRWVHVDLPGAAGAEPFASSGPDALLAAVRDAHGGRVTVPASALPGVTGTVAFEVDLDRAGRVRRLVLRPEVPAGSVSVTVELRDLGRAVVAPVPPPGRVVEGPVG